MVVDYLCCCGCFLCYYGGGGLFDFFDFLCFCGFLVAEVVVMGFFSIGSGGFLVTEVVVMVVRAFTSENASATGTLRECENATSFSVVMGL